MKSNTKTFICPICGEEVRYGNPWHMKQCIKHLDPNIANKMINMYNDGISINDIRDAFNQKYAYSFIRNVLRKHGIHIRNISEASSQLHTRNKYKETMLEHYGTTHNFNKDCESRKQWELRLYETEGITNVFQRESVKQQIKDTLHKRYTPDELYYHYTKGSTLNYWIEKLGETDGLKKYNEICFNKGKSNRIEYYIDIYGEEKGIELYNQRLKKAQKSLKYNRGFNKQAADILDKYGIEYVTEFCISIKDNTNKKCYLYDLKIGNVLIELNGTYWHCSPKKYLPNDLVKFPNNHFVKACDKWEADRIKCEYAKQHGYDIIIIWEEDFTEEYFINILKTHNLWKPLK